MTVKLLFGVHNHQPVGNFDHVFKKGYEICYNPFLNILEEHPEIRMSLHFTGPLYEWFLQNQPDFIQRIKTMVAKNQIELLGGAFYEPLLSIIPENDGVGQIEKMIKFCNQHFNTSPKGMWLAERVWDSSIISCIGKAGMHFTILDDTHFLYAGVDGDALHGYYLTEKEGVKLGLFPIDMKLRYTIPFKEPEETIKYLFDHSDGGKKDIAFTYADDGEKFGMWPETHEWVYKKKWLHRFFNALEKEKSWLQVIPLGEYFKTAKPSGRIYIPNASYEEMLEWALPPKRILMYEKIKHRLQEDNKWESFRPFFRGGLYNNFLVKYSESNHLQKRMMRISYKVKNAYDSASAKKKDQMITALYKGQCNCPYWHGLFGGLYLNYLRNAVYQELIHAERLTDEVMHSDTSWGIATFSDYDKDGRDEVIVDTGFLSLYMLPYDAGTIREISLKQFDFNLTNVMMRRFEAYHDKLKNIDLKAAKNGKKTPLSIHDMVKVKEEGLDKHLVVDRYERTSVAEFFAAPSTKLPQVIGQKYEELIQTRNTNYKVTIEDKNNIKIIHYSSVFNENQKKIELNKTYNVVQGLPQFSVTYKIENQGDEPFNSLFGVEWNLTLLAGHGDGRTCDVKKSDSTEKIEKLSFAGTFETVKEIVLSDETKNLKVVLKNDKDMNLWVYPIETVSQSEDGFERNYQGTSFIFNKEILINKKENFEVTFIFEFGNR